MRRGIFHKYLLGFTSFFLVPMVVLSICLQIIMYRNLSREILGYNENILERLGDDLVTMNGRLMEAGNRISFSGPVVSRSRDAQNQIQMVDMLREENAANPYITKAYILYENGDMSFSSQGRYAKDILLAGQLRLPEEERQPFLEKLYNMDHPGYDVINKEYHMKDGIITRPQMVFIYPVYNYSFKVESWVVLELQPSKISQSMTTSPGSYSHGIAVLNGEGKILATEGEDLGLDEVMGRVLEAEPGSCTTFQERAGQGRYIVYPMDHPSLIILSKITMPDLLADVVQNNSLLVTGVLLFLILGCFMAIYMAYHYYKPIHQLAQYMKQDNENSEDRSRDELVFIKHQYDSLNSVRDSLAKEIEKQWPLVEERLVTKLLYGEDDTREDGTREDDMVNGILTEQMKGRNHMVILAAGGNMSSRELSALYKEKEGPIKERFQTDYGVYTSFLYYFGAIAVILSRKVLTEEHRIGARERLKEVFGSCECVISAGNIHEDASGVHLSYLEALTNMKFRLLNPHKELDFENLEQGKGEEYSATISRYQTECLLCISRCLESGSPEGVEGSVQEVVLSLEELPGQMALMCCYDIVSHLLKEVKKNDIRLTEKELYQLTAFRTVEEFGEKLGDALMRINGVLAASRQDTRNDLVKQVLVYIEDNYRDSSLCLVGMAEHFGYSSSYMSKFITQNLNTSFSELISKKRLDYTKDCLIHTDKQIAQIAQEAGYANLSNFTRRFKSSENMTPGQYRNLYGDGKKI